MEESITLGQYLAQRLQEIGLKDYFAIPGDFNLSLLDELLKNKHLQMINCCNELNAGYAADGYARAKGKAALVLTYCVGGLSALNAVTGAYAEDLPIIVISGGPNANSAAAYQLLHHTTALHNYRYVRNIFAQVTASAVIIDHPDDATYLIDQAIKTALQQKKPVYIEIACNLANIPVSMPDSSPIFAKPKSDEKALRAAVEHVARVLNAAVKPTLVAGVRLRSWNALEAFQNLADASGYAVASMPNAKGFLSEEHPNFIGIYWGPVSSPGCGEIVESSDRYLFAGPLFTDYTTTGYSALIDQKKLILAGPDHVKLDGKTYSNVMLSDFLAELTTKIKRNDNSLKAYQRVKGEAPTPEADHPDAPVTVRRLFAKINQLLDKDSATIVETGDSWFNSMRLKLPEGCRYEIQMQYGSIGWSVGATLGYAIAMKGEKRVIALIGDGSFQMTAQEISTMIRYKVNPIIFLINNGGYTIEVEIHDGPYNVIKNWKYMELIKVFNAEDGNARGFLVRTEKELAQSIEQALAHDGLSFIEVIIDRDDCNKLLLQWGTRVSANNSKPPKSLTGFYYS